MADADNKKGSRKPADKRGVDKVTEMQNLSIGPKATNVSVHIGSTSFIGFVPDDMQHTTEAHLVEPKAAIVMSHDQQTSYTGTGATNAMELPPPVYRKAPQMAFPLGPNGADFNYASAAGPIYTSMYAAQLSGAGIRDSVIADLKPWIMDQVKASVPQVIKEAVTEAAAGEVIAALRQSITDQITGSVMQTIKAAVAEAAAMQAKSIVDGLLLAATGQQSIPASDATPKTGLEDDTMTCKNRHGVDGVCNDIIMAESQSSPMTASQESLSTAAASEP